MNHTANADDNHDEEKLRREVALFRYGLIADLAHLPPGTPGIRDRLRAKAEHSVHDSGHAADPRGRRDPARLNAEEGSLTLPA